MQAIARRKDLYEERHPEARQGGDRKSTRQTGELNAGGTNKGKARTEVANLASSVDRFTLATAQATGRSERAVQHVPPPTVRH